MKLAKRINAIACNKNVIASVAKQSLAFVTVAGLAFALTACGSDAGTDSGKGSSESAVGETAEVKTVYGLGECEASNEGVVKLVTSEDQYYKCADGEWEETGAPAQSSSSKNSLFAKGSSSSVSSFAGSSSSNKSFLDLESKSSASSEIFSTDSKSEYDPVKQTLKDFRDGKTYRTVKIGDQVWMAENLNYRYLGPTADEDSSSFCYDDDPANCTKYGRLYLWSAAMDSAGIIKGNTANGCGHLSECTPSEPVRGVCPQGWHLPSFDEWKILIVVVDGDINEYSRSNKAGTKLKSISGWKWDSDLEQSGNGTDSFGFSMLPAGYRTFDDGLVDDLGLFRGDSMSTLIWSSSLLNNCIVDRGHCTPYVTSYYHHFDYDSMDIEYTGKWHYGLSVRCLKD